MGSGEWRMVFRFDPPFAARRSPLASPKGAIAQLGERVLCKHEVVGSIPSGSTRIRDAEAEEAGPDAEIFLR